MTKINRTDLRDVDLNLLVAFEALMQTRSVTQAAERLRVGQPAASYSLRKLREILDDPLFVRTRAGMSPTPRALALAEPIRLILANIQSTLFAGPSFDPQRQAHIFRVGANDYAQAILGEQLLATLRARAPHCKLMLSTSSCETVQRDLEKGDIDLAIGPFPEVTNIAHRHLLFREHSMCVYDAKACGLKGPITLDEWLALPHIIMSTRGDYTAPIDDVLKSAGRKREVVVSTPHFLAIPLFLKNKRLIASLPSRLARICRKHFGLSIGKLPLQAPEFDVVMLWNARTAHEPAAIWLRDQISHVSDALIDPATEQAA